MKKYLILISLVYMFMTFSGCGTLVKYKEFRKITMPNVERVSFPGALYAKYQKLVFKTNADIYKKSLSGILIVKIYKKKHYRVIFLKEIGITLMDIEINEGSDPIVHRCIDELNKKYIVKNIAKKIDLVLSAPEGGLMEALSDENDLDIYKYKYLDEYNHYFYNKKEKQVVRLENVSKKYKKVNIEFIDYTSVDNVMLPTKINISDYRIKLRIRLLLLEADENKING